MKTGRYSGRGCARVHSRRRPRSSPPSSAACSCSRWRRPPASSTAPARPRSSASSPPPACASPVVVAKPLAGNGFSPAQIYRGALGRRRHDLQPLQCERLARRDAGQGSGFVVSPRRRHPDERPCDHDRRPGRLGATARARGLRRVPGRRPRPGADRRLRPLRRRRRPPGRSARRTRSRRCRSAIRPRVVVGQPVAAIGSPFGNADSLSVGVVSAVAPVDPVVDDELRPRRRDPDRRADQPRQLGRAALRRARARDRHQRADPLDRRHRLRGRRVRGADRLGAGGRWRSSIATGKVRYAYVGITTEDLTPAIAKKFGYRRDPRRADRRVRRRRPGGQARGPRAAATARGASRARVCTSAVTRSSRSTASRCAAPRTSSAWSPSDSSRARRRRSRSSARGRRRERPGEARRASAVAVRTPRPRRRTPSGRESGRISEVCHDPVTGRGRLHERARRR